MAQRTQGEEDVIRLVFQCDGAAGRERLRECDSKEVVRLSDEGFGEGILVRVVRDAVEVLLSKGWTFRRFGARFIVRCLRCETLRVERNTARAQRDKLREARKR